MTIRNIALCLAPLALASCTAASQQTASAPPTKAQTYQAGMVSAADPRAAEAGVSMLRQGGSATDAAIATMLALTVVEPQSSGIGGGGLFVTTNAKGLVETIDGREKAPAAAHPKWFFKDGKLMSFSEAVPGGTSVGVPGNVALAAKAHGAHGRLTWSALFAPAIKLAREGFQVTPRLMGALKASIGRYAGNDRGAGGQGVLHRRHCPRDRGAGHHRTAQSRADDCGRCGGLYGQGPGPGLCAVSRL